MARFAVLCASMGDEILSVLHGGIGLALTARVLPGAIGVSTLSVFDRARPNL